MPSIPAIEAPEATPDELERQVRQWVESDALIDDGAARAVATIYRGPRSPETTQLSEGKPSDAYALAEEVVRSHIPSAPQDDDDLAGRPALRALVAWIVERSASTAA